MVKKVLTIDDQGGIRRLIRMTLEFEGHTVIEAMDAITGLQAVHDEKPDLILLGLNMPRIPGLELCRRLSHDPKLSAIPVILLTSCEDPEVRQRGREAGAKAFLTKPFSPVQLLDLIEEYTR